MIKIFLSHSWAQKEFVNKVADYIGKDFAIVDRFVFESGKNIEEEINNSLDSSNVFVMLISNESLDSKWCKHELSRFRDNMLDANKVEFIPFIIDETDINDKRIKNWIRAYLTNNYTNALLLARVIRRRVCEVLWKANPQIQATSRIFLGRDNDVSSITSDLNKSIDTDRRAIIVTGLPHIGRKRLLREVYVTRMSKNIHPSYDLYDISLNDCDSIEDFIEQLNDFVQVYSKEDLRQKMCKAESCKDLAVELINKVESFHERIRITDNKCIVNVNGSLADWFKDIINHPNLVKQVMLFVASSCSLSPKQRRENVKVQAHNIDVIQKKYLREIFVAYAKCKNIICNDDDINFFIDSLSGFPKQVYCVVDDIADVDIFAAKKDLNNIKALYDSDMQSLLETFQYEKNHMQLLLIMSKFEFISYDFLTQIYKGKDIDNILEKFRFYSIYETFGSCNQYMRISPTLANYIDRSKKFKLNKNYENQIKDISKSYISITDNDSLDLSQDLFRIKEQIKDPQFVISTDYILPSYALKVIVDLYRKGDNENVVKIAHKVLYDYKRNNYETITYPIRYWMCLSYCKLQDNNIFEELKYFHDYAYYFILGYYFRINGNYKQAQINFEKALTFKTEGKSRKYYKAEHELVICLMKQGLYVLALDIAKGCYDKDSTNPYFIEAYFRCYIRSSYFKVEVLRNLIEDIKRVTMFRNDAVILTMEAEFQYFVNKNVTEALKNLKSIIDNYHGKDIYYTLDTYKEICRKQKINYDLPVITNTNNEVYTDDDLYAGIV